MNNKLQTGWMILSIAFLIVVSACKCYAGKTTMTGSNGNSVVANTIAVTTSDSVTLTTTTQNGTVTVTYDYSSSPGVNGPTTATASPGSPATSVFTFSSDASGNSNTINVSTIQTGATDSNGMTCMPNTSSPSYTVVVPQVVINNITNVASFGSYQRVPIYGGPTPIEGTVSVTVTPALLSPPGTTIQFKIKNNGGNGLAQFDNGSASIDLTGSGSLNIQGVANSSAADNLEIDAFLDDNSSDQIIDSSNPQSILLFTVSTWPINFNETGVAGPPPYVITNLDWDSESGNLSDLGNVYMREDLSTGAFPSPPFAGAYSLNGTIVVTSGGGGSGDFDIDSFVPSYDQNGIDGSSLTAGVGNMSTTQKIQFQDFVLGSTWTTLDGGTYNITTSVTHPGAGYSAVTNKTGGAGAPFTSSAYTY